MAWTVLGYLAAATDRHSRRLRDRHHHSWHSRPGLDAGLVRQDAQRLKLCGRPSPPAPLLALAATFVAVLLSGSGGPSDGPLRLSRQRHDLRRPDFPLVSSAHRAWRGASAVRRLTSRLTCSFLALADRPHHYRPALRPAFGAVDADAPSSAPGGSLDAIWAAPPDHLLPGGAATDPPGLVTGSIFAFIASWINVELSHLQHHARPQHRSRSSSSTTCSTPSTRRSRRLRATILVAVVAVIVLDLTSVSTFCQNAHDLPAHPVSQGVSLMRRRHVRCRSNTIIPRARTTVHRP